MEEKLRYATVMYGVRKQLGVSFNEYILLDMIYHLSARYGFCYKSTASIADDMGLTFNAIKVMIQRLVEKGYLVKDHMKLHVTNRYIDIAYFDKYDETTVIAKSEALVQKVQSIAKTSDKNNKENNNRISMSTHVEARKLFYQLIEALGCSETTKFTDERRRKLLTRRKTYMPAALLQAAAAIADNPFMQGDNENGRKYGTIDYLLRNDTVVDKWLQQTEHHSASEEIAAAVQEAI